MTKLRISPKAHFCLVLLLFIISGGCLAMTFITDNPIRAGWYFLSGMFICALDAVLVVIHVRLK